MPNAANSLGDTGALSFCAKRAILVEFFDCAQRKSLADGQAH
jgi:hypothetical protein